MNIGARQYHIKINIAISCSPNFKKLKYKGKKNKIPIPMRSPKGLSPRSQFNYYHLQSIQSYYYSLALSASLGNKALPSKQPRLTAPSLRATLALEKKASRNKILTLVAPSSTRISYTHPAFAAAAFTVSSLRTSLPLPPYKR